LAATFAALRSTDFVENEWKTKKRCYETLGSTWAQELAAIGVVLGNREVMIESGGSQAPYFFELEILP